MTEIPPETIRCGNRYFCWSERTYLMGVLNVTPDSFSGDGLGDDIGAIVEKGRRLESEGADIIDIGGESTRPGFTPVPLEEELRRVIPAVERLAAAVSVPISVDTTKPGVAAQALAAGAAMINDVLGLEEGDGLARLAAVTKAPLIIMSNQRQRSGRYDIMKAVISSLKRGLNKAVECGVAEEKIILDPGIGFGKSAAQNLEIISRLAEIKSLGRPVLLGTSRKLGGRTPEEKLAVTAATSALGINNGANIIRIHDVKAMARVAKICDAINGRKTK